jgi:thiol-disulfide isomerase/thioredoxin
MTTRRTSALATTAALLAALVLGGCATTTHPIASSAPSANEEAVQRASGALGGAAALAAAQGKVVVVAFYGTWCPAARNMLRAVAGLSKKHGGRGLVVMGVAEQDNAAEAESYARAVGIEGPITLDADGQMARALELETVPAIVVVGRDGVVRRIHAGYHGGATDAPLGREVTALLAAPRRGENARELVAAE